MKSHKEMPTLISKQLHFVTILVLGLSASLWAITATNFTMPVVWLLLLCILVALNNPLEFRHFFKRFAQIGSTLIILSLFQIIFRRQGEVLIWWNQFPLIFSVGLREAILLWIRFMILFVLANIFAQVSLFNFLLFANKIRLSLKLSLLFLITLKLIPFIFSEAKRGLWFLRFRGIQISKLSLRNKLLAFRKLLFSLLMRGIQYTSYSALALEIRGYGKSSTPQIPQAYPLRFLDYGFILLSAILNGFGLLII